MTLYQSGTSGARTQPGRAHEQLGRAKEKHCARQLMLPAAADAASLARRATRDALTAWRMTHLEETAVLLVSEIVTNVVRHARAFPPFMMLGLETADACLRIEVHDADPRWPRPRTPAALDESGFGFLIVDALADRWGVRDMPEGKAVWVELETRPGREAVNGTGR